MRIHRPVMLVMAAFSRHDSALNWAREMSCKHWGELLCESDRFVFDQTSFYEREMGSDLRKTFFAYANLVDPLDLPAVKLQAIAWEKEFASADFHEESRPLNLDPGYLTEAKFVLATTKDRDHRLVLADGIFGEVTLYFHRGTWTTREWTYPDYCRREYHDFFTKCRNELRDLYYRDGTLGLHT